MIFQCIASIFVIVGIYLASGLTPEKVTEDLLNIMTPKDSLREEVRNLRGNKKRHKLYTAVMNFKNALSATGKGKQFSLVCFLSLVLMAGGVVDDERQQQKMTDEFYVNYKRDLEKYQETIQRFIDNGCESKIIIERWTQKIRALQQKKRTYEEVLKRQLDDLNGDYDMLTMQLNELCVIGRTREDQIPLAA